MLTEQQARFFARNGYLQLRGFVAEATCHHLVERTWAVLPCTWRRDDPDSWGGEVADSCHAAPLPQRAGLLKYQVKELATDRHVVAVFQPPSPVHDVAAALVGRPLHPIRVRGLYAIAPVPRPELLPRSPSPHVEAHAANLIVLTYLDDVAPGGGGLLVWPGSHRDLWSRFDSKLEYAARPELAARIAHWRALEPIELSGARGDVVLTHHRLLHSPSVNRTRRIRFGFLCDYTPRDHFAQCGQPPGIDLWEDWPGLRQLAGGKDLDAPSEHRLRRAARSPPRRWWPFAWPRRATVAGSAASTAPATPAHSPHAPGGAVLTEQNKLDASRLARSRRAGDVWLSLSDSPLGFGDALTLDPRGGELEARGVRVALNGRALTSSSRGDFTARLDVVAGSNELVVTGVAGPLWLRVIAIRLPFAHSVALLRQRIDAGAEAVHCTFEVGSERAVDAGT